VDEPNLRSFTPKTNKSVGTLLYQPMDRILPLFFEQSRRAWNLHSTACANFYKKDLKEKQNYIAVQIFCTKHPKGSRRNTSPRSPPMKMGSRSRPSTPPPGIQQLGEVWTCSVAPKAIEDRPMEDKEIRASPNSSAAGPHLADDSSGEPAPFFGGYCRDCRFHRLAPPPPPRMGRTRTPIILLLPPPRPTTRIRSTHIPPLKKKSPRTDTVAIFDL
jgi:hypothetical protein